MTGGEGDEEENGDGGTDGKGGGGGGKWCLSSSKDDVGLGTRQPFLFGEASSLDVCLLLFRRGLSCEGSSWFLLRTSTCSAA